MTGIGAPVGARAASLIAGTSCDVSELTIGGASASDCAGTYEGNDKPSAGLELLDGGVFGDFGNWSLAASDDRDFSTSGGKNGSWNLDGVAASGPLAIAVKGGPSFSLYFFDVAEDTQLTGTFGTDGVVKGNGKPGPGLSHLSLYIAPASLDSEEPSRPGSGVAVPEPATTVGLSVIAVAGAIARQRRRRDS